jgi:hypothetical protein
MYLGNRIEYYSTIFTFFRFLPNNTTNKIYKFTYILDILKDSFLDILSEIHYFSKCTFFIMAACILNAIAKFMNEPILILCLWCLSISFWLPRELQSNKEHWIKLTFHRILSLEWKHIPIKSLHCSFNISSLW